MTIEEIKEMGMTNEQYKGTLLDQREDWQEVIELLKEGKNEKALEKAEKQIDKIDEKMKL